MSELNDTNQEWQMDIAEEQRATDSSYAPKYATHDELTAATNVLMTDKNQLAKLRRYAHKYVQWIPFHSGDDVLNDALRLIFRGAKKENGRKWDQEKYPQFHDYVRRVIWTICRNLWDKYQQEINDVSLSEDGIDETGFQYLGGSLTPPSLDFDPVRQYQRKQLHVRLLSICEVGTIARRVLEARLRGFSKSECLELLNITSTQYDSACVQIARKGNKNKEIFSDWRVKKCTVTTTTR